MHANFGHAIVTKMTKNSCCDVGVHEGFSKEMESSSFFENETKPSIYHAVLENAQEMSSPTNHTDSRQLKTHYFLL